MSENMKCNSVYCRILERAAWNRLYPLTEAVANTL